MNARSKLRSVPGYHDRYTKLDGGDRYAQHIDACLCDRSGDGYANCVDNGVKTDI